jgi:hypothetical protein
MKLARPIGVLHEQQGREVGSLSSRSSVTISAAMASASASSPRSSRA